MPSRTEPGLTTTISCLFFIALLLGLCGCGEAQKSSVPEPASESSQLLTNGSFTNGFEGWEVIDRGGTRAHGENKVKPANGPEGGSAVQIERFCPEKDGGASGLEQPLDVTLEPGSRLDLAADFRIDYEKGGALAGSDPGWHPECAVQFRIFYEEPGGTEEEWYHGFYYSDVDDADVEHFTRVKKGEWESYDSGDIADEIPEGAKLTRFRVYGFGWDFDGYISDVSLRLAGK